MTAFRKTLIASFTIVGFGLVSGGAFAASGQGSQAGASAVSPVPTAPVSAPVAPAKTAIQSTVATPVAGTAVKAPEVKGEAKGEAKGHDAKTPDTKHQDVKPVAPAVNPAMDAQGKDIVKETSKNIQSVK